MNVRYDKNSKIVEIRDVGKLFTQAQLEQVVVNLQNLRMSSLMYTMMIQIELLVLTYVVLLILDI